MEPDELEVWEYSDVLTSDYSRVMRPSVILKGVLRLEESEFDARLVFHAYGCCEGDPSVA